MAVIPTATRTAIAMVIPMVTPMVIPTAILMGTPTDTRMDMPIGTARLATKSPTRFFRASMSEPCMGSFPSSTLLTGLSLLRMMSFLAVPHGWVAGFPPSRRLRASMRTSTSRRRLMRNGSFQRRCQQLMGKPLAKPFLFLYSYMHIVTLSMMVSKRHRLPNLPNRPRTALRSCSLT